MAAVDYFLKIDTIPGESGDHKHKDEIQLESWSFGEQQTGTMGFGGGGGSGKVSMQDFHFTMKMNKASPQVFLACAEGRHIPAAVLTCRKAGGKQEEFLKVKFGDLLLSSYDTSGSGSGDDIPTESISFNFAKIDWEYQQQNEKGQVGNPVKVGYNLKTQTAT